MIGAENKLLWQNLRSNTVEKIYQNGKVFDIIFSENNQFFFSCDGNLYQSDTQEFGKQLLRSTKYGLIKSISFSKKNRLLTSGGDDKEVIIWDIQGKQQIASFSGHSKPILTISFSPNGQIIASGGEDKLIRLWNTNILQNENTISTNDYKDDHSHCITCLKFSFDGQILASASRQFINILNVQSKQYYSVLKQHQGQVRILEFSRDQHFLLSCDWEKVTLWNIKNLNDIIPIFQTPRLHILEIAQIIRNKKILTFNDRELHLWNLNTQEKKKSEICMYNDIDNFLLVPNQLSIAILYEGSLMFHNVSNEPHSELNFDNYQGNISNLAFSQDGKKMATINDYCFLTIWIQENQFEWIKYRQCILYKQLQETKFTLQFSKNDQYINFISKDQVQFFSYQNQNEMIIEQQLATTELLFTNFNRTLIALVQNENWLNSISIYSYKSDFNQINKFTGFQSQIKSINFSFEKNIIAIGDSNGQIFLFDYESGLQFIQPLQSKGSIHEISFVKNSVSTLISSCLINSNRDGNIFHFTKWNFLDQSSSDLNLISETLNIVHLSPLGFQLAVIASKTQKLLLYNFQNDKDNKQIQEIEINSKAKAIVISFDPNEIFLSIGTSDGSILIYDLQSQIISDRFSQKLSLIIQLISCSLIDNSMLICCENAIFQIFLNEKLQILQVNYLLFDSSIAINQIFLLNRQNALIFTDKKHLLKTNILNKTVLKRYQFESESHIQPMLLQNGLIFTKDNDKIKLYSLKEKKKIDEIDCLPSKKFYLSPNEKLFVFTQRGNLSFSNFDQLKNHSQAKQFQAHYDTQIINVVISKNQQYLSSLDDERRIKFWDIKDETKPQIKFIFTNALVSLMYFSSDSIYFVRQEGLEIIIIEIESYQQSFRHLSHIKLHDEEVLLIKSFENSDNEEELLIITSNQVLQTGIDTEYLKVLLNFQHRVKTVAVGEESHILSYVIDEYEGKDFGNFIYVIKNFEQELPPLKSQQKRVNSLSFSLDCKLLLSGGQDYSIKIWCMEKLVQLAELKNLGDSVTKVSFSPDGLHFASGFLDGAFGLYISNLTKHTSKKKYDELVKQLGDQQIGCLKIFSPQPLLQLQKCKIENMKMNEEKKALFDQKRY